MPNRVIGFRRIFFHVILLTIGIAPFFSSCSTKTGGDEEGVIEFDTRALDEKNSLYGFAPSSATLRFKKEKFCMEMSTMGMFNMLIIGDNKTKVMVSAIKFMNLKQACIDKEADLLAANEEYRLKFEETEETKKIAGLKCYKVKATNLSDPGTPTFDIWYTRELGMENCNMLTSYAPIKGVLMDYRLKRFGLEMQFVAKSYENKEVTDNTFEIPASMKIVSKDEMNKFFKDLQ